MFYVHDLRSHLNKKITTHVVNPTIWIKHVLLKCSNFVTRACMGGITMATALSHRGMIVASASYSMCSDGIEDAGHLFVGCLFSHGALIL